MKKRICPGCGEMFDLPQWYVDNPDPRGSPEFCQPACASRHAAVINGIRRKLEIHLMEGGMVSWTID